jgi:hypothetical protein
MVDMVIPRNDCQNYGKVIADCRNFDSKKCLGCSLYHICECIQSNAVHIVNNKYGGK